MRIFFRPKASFNAMRQQPKPRHDDGHRPVTWQQPVMREEWVKTAARGFGLLHVFDTDHGLSSVL
jgi:hypothetical protein